MKTWDEVSKEMQSHGTPLSALGYCKIAYDAGQESMADTANGAFMDGRNNALAEREQEMCEWVPEDEDSNWYGSQCGMSFVFEDGGAVHNGFNFCPKCGKKLKEIPWDNSEDDAE